MKSGLYLLAGLDGSPPTKRDRRVMGFAPGTPLTGPAAMVGIVDPSVDGAHSGLASSDGRLLAFAGYLDAPEALRLRLGEPGLAPAALVLVAIRKWGEAAFSRLPGEWSLALVEPGRALLASSPNLRDPMYFASDGHRLAVAPSMATLSDLDWVGDGIAALPMLQSMSGWIFRRELEGQTWLEKIRCVDHSTSVEVTRAQQRRSVWYHPTAEAPWKGDFVEAIAELEARSRRVVAAHLRRHGDVAVMLSGGLDSSTLAWLVAAELGAGQRATAVTSVKPSGGALTDESAFARLAASHLGLPLVELNPDPDPSVYRPSHRTMASREIPTAGPRHYLYEALYDAAAAAGATGIFDGQLGERSLTRRTRTWAPMTALRALREDLRHRRASAVEAPDWPAAGMQVMPSTSALAQLVSAVGTAPKALASEPIHWPGTAMGIPRGAEKQGRIATAAPGLPLRSILAFRDPELVAFVASLPGRFTHATGLPRSLARAMIADNMPAEIVRRTSKAPFAPDYYERLAAQSAEARLRIPTHRKNGADEWLDLDWLDANLARIGTRKVPPPTAFRIQETAAAAEFISWWRTERRLSD